MPVLYTCQFEEDANRSNGAIPGQHFPRYKLMEHFCCHGNHRSDQGRSKTICSRSQPTTILQDKFDHDWATC